MKDRFTRGFIVGFTAGIPSFVWGITAFSLGWTNIRWAHFAATLIYGRKFMNLPEDIFASFAVFFFCGLMGVIFSLMITKVSNANLIFKAWVYAIVIWFFAFAITFLYKVPDLLIIPFNSTIVNFIEASIWGLSLGCCLHWLEKSSQIEI